jgi:hypothetical protein
VEYSCSLGHSMDERMKLGDAFERQLLADFDRVHDDGLPASLSIR